MGAVMWIEVLSRHGDVAARERIEADEARVGRAFDNDVVVDDPHVAPHHLRIFRGEDGELVAEDLGTLNGLYPEHGARRVPRLPLAQEPGIRIGRTTLRVHDAAHAVAPEKRLTPPRAHAAWAAGLTVAMLAALLLLEWLTLTKEATANRLLLPLLEISTAVVLWSGVWALLSRLFLGQARFALQLRVAVTAFLALIAWDQLTETLSFALAWREISEYAMLGAWAILGAACYAHLVSIGPRHLRVAVGTIVALVATGALIQYANKAEARRVAGQPATLGDLRPPQFRVRPMSSVDAFLRSTEATRRKVDEARKREPEGGSALGDADAGD